MTRLVLLSALIISVLIVSLSFAGIPKLINYQGMLTTPGGSPVTDGQYNLTFKIYGSESDNDSLWWEHHTNVDVANGLFNVILGSLSPISSSVFDDSLRYLGIKVGDDPELTPRTRLTSVGYAYRAWVADSASVAVSAPTGGGWTDNETVVRLTTNNDSVGIGTANPSTKLDVQGTLRIGVEGAGYDVNFYGDSTGSRMFWDKSKMSFRAGRAPDHQWDEDSTGLWSFAACNKTKASGLASTALGSKTAASGDLSTAMGFITTASGIAATAMGGGTIASGTYSTAMGEGTTANGWASTAVGQCVMADAIAAMTFGSGVYGKDDLVNDVPHSLMVGFKSTTPTLFVDSLNVGIGTTAPSAKLHVENASGDNSLKVRSADGCTSSFKLFEANDYGFEFEYSGTDDKLHLWSRKFASNEGIRMTWLKDGKVGIGTTNPAYKLDVNGDINVSGSYNIKKGGTNYNHPDYVFEPDYDLMSLEELKKYVSKNKSLPNVISADDVKKNDGFKMDELMIQMLEKIEEQTLYIFQLEERIAKLEKQIR